VGAHQSLARAGRCLADLVRLLQELDVEDRAAHELLNRLRLPHKRLLQTLQKGLGLRAIVGLEHFHDTVAMAVALLHEGQNERAVLGLASGLKGLEADLTGARQAGVEDLANALGERKRAAVRRVHCAAARAVTRCQALPLRWALDRLRRGCLRRSLTAGGARRGAHRRDDW